MINPPLVTDRLIRQSGKFSYHPDDSDMNLITQPRANGEELIKIVISPDDDGKNPTQTIQEQLGILNIHQAALFPDSDGVAKFINTHWRNIAR